MSSGGSENRTSSQDIELFNFQPAVDISWSDGTTNEGFRAFLEPHYTSFANHSLHEDIDRFVNGVRIRPRSHPEIDMDLHEAARTGYTKNIEKLLDVGSELVNALDERGLTALHYSAQHNQPQAIKTLLNCGANINVHDKFESTPLQTASRYNATEAVEVLLLRGADPHLGDAVSGSTPLHLAASYGNPSVMTNLLQDKRIDVNVTNQQGVTALHTACCRGYDVLCAFLLQKGARVDTPAEEGMTALHYAASNANPKMVCLLLDSEWRRRFRNSGIASKRKDKEEYRQFLNSRDSEQNTALHLAAQTGNVVVSQVLIEQGAEVNLQNKALQTPLHLATICGSSQVLKLLIQKGGNINYKDNQNCTPLHIAASLGNVDCVNLLLEKGADIESVDDSSLSPFLSAVAAGQTYCAKLLLDSGAKMTSRDVRLRNCLHLAVEKEKLETLTMLLNETEEGIINAGDNMERTPLHYAALANDVKILEALVEKNANCILKDSSYKTPLHLAAEKGRTRQVEILSQAGLACIWQLDQSKRTPLHYAVMNKRKKSTSVLIELGSDINRPDINGWTPLMWASKTGSDAIVKTLLEKYADIDHVDLEGNTALHVSALYGHVEITRLLLDEGAKVSTNKNGMTCSDAAMDTQNSDVIMVIVKHPRWKEILVARDPGGVNSMERFIQQCPEASEIVFDRCVQRSPSKRTVTYDFHLLDPGPDDQSGRDGQRFYGLETMYEKKQQNLLKHPLCRKHLKTKWRTFGLTIYLTNLLLYLVFLCGMSAFMLIEREHVKFHKDARNNDQPFVAKSYTYKAIPYIITAFALANLLKEVYQLVTQRFRYFTDPTNLLEWCVYLTVIIFLLPYTLHYTVIRSSSPSLFWQTGTVAIFLGYVNLLFFLQTMDYVGLYVTMFIEVMKTMCKVLVLFVMFAFAFALVFFTLLKEEDDFATIGLSIIKVVAMTTGEFDYSDILVSSFGEVNPNTGLPLVPYESLSLVFFLIFVLAMTIVLMNLMVGLAVGDIESIQKTASMRNKGRQIRFIVEVEKKYPRFITRLLYKPVVVSQLKKGKTKSTRADEFQDEDLVVEEEVDRQDVDEQRYRSLCKDFTKVKNRQKELTSMMEQQREILTSMASRMGIDVTY